MFKKGFVRLIAVLVSFPSLVFPVLSLLPDGLTLRRVGFGIFCEHCSRAPLHSMTRSDCYMTHIFTTCWVNVLEEVLPGGSFS